MSVENLPTYHWHAKNIYTVGVWTDLTQITISNQDSENLIFSDKTMRNMSLKMAVTKLITNKGTVSWQMDTIKTINSLSFHLLTPLVRQFVVLLFSSQIRMSQNLKVKIRVDVKRNPNRDRNRKIDVGASSSQENYFPGEPNCEYNGKVFDCLTFISESSGIASKILIKILKYFGINEVFPRFYGGPIPILFIDGHQLWLDPSFTVQRIDDFCRSIMEDLTDWLTTLILSHS